LSRSCAQQALKRISGWWRGAEIFKEPGGLCLGQGLVAEFFDDEDSLPFSLLDLDSIFQS